MRKILSIALFFVFFNQIAHAENCPIKPSCEELGYLFSEKDCEGSKILKCPFDRNKVFCNKEKNLSTYTGRNCVIGDIFSTTHHRCTTEKNAAIDYIFIENIQQSSSPMALTLMIKKDSLHLESLTEAKKLHDFRTDRLITQAQLKKILPYFLLHYQYRCALTQENLIWVDETTGKIYNINSEEDFKLCSDPQNAPNGAFYDLRTAKLIYNPL